MRIIIIFAIGILGISCGTSKVEVEHMIVNPEEVGVARIGDVRQETDSYSIKSARIENNLLILQVEFSGGCIIFVPDLVGSEFLMKSLPPKRNIKLILKKEGECRELKSEQFVFDITELAYKQEKGSEIILLLQNYDKPIQYVYH